jgi:hypothetical protein
MNGTHLENGTRLRRAAAVLGGAVVAVPAAVSACPMCEVALKGDPVVAAFNWTTLLLIAVPTLLMGSIGGWVSYVYWRESRRPGHVGWSAVWIEKEGET